MSYATVTDKAITGYLVSTYSSELLVSIILTGKMSREAFALEMLEKFDRSLLQGNDLIEHANSYYEDALDAFRDSQIVIDRYHIAFEDIYVPQTTDLHKVKDALENWEYHIALDVRVVDSEGLEIDEDDSMELARELYIDFTCAEHAASKVGTEIIKYVSSIDGQLEASLFISLDKEGNEIASVKYYA